MHVVDPIVFGSDANSISDRINCYCIGPWLTSVLEQLGGNLPDGLAIPRNRVQLSIPAHGLRLTFFRRAERSGDDWTESVVLDQAVFSPANAKLPFDLDPTSETLASSRVKLSNDMVGNNERTSFFLTDARVVELTFCEGGTGIVQVLVARLGCELKFGELRQPSR